MDNNEQFGDFTVLDDVVSKLTGGFDSPSSGTSFPIMDIREDEDEDEFVDFDTKNSGGFKDERTEADTDSDNGDSGEDSKNTDEGSAEEDEEDSMDGTSEDDSDSDFQSDKKKGDKKPNSEDETSFEDNDSSSETGKNISELGEDEPEIAAFVQEKLFDKLGWEIGDEDKFDTVSDLVDYMEKIVEANSKPEFANKDLEQLNTFVKEGGDLRSFFDTQGELDVDKLDLGSEYNQKTIIKEALKERGYSDTQIDKAVNRYDQSGILEDEAIEAKEFVQKSRQEKSETLLKNQTILRQEQERQQQKFYKDVNSSIDGLDNVKGIPVNKADRIKLKDAILKVGSDGQTLYQKKYNENLIKNMLESAYFTLKEDTMIKDLTKRAESQATKNLKRKLETRTKKGRGSVDTENTSTDKGHSALDVFNFIKP